MNKNLIKIYASKLTKEDIIKYANKEGITLTEKDLSLISNALTNDIDYLLIDPISYINTKRNEISDASYEILISYYEKYKKFI